MPESARCLRLRARAFATREPVTVNVETKLVVQRDDVTVKIEVSTVM